MSAFSSDPFFLATATAQVQLYNVDVKKRVRTMRGHQARVSSLAWNKSILTSAGRDNLIMHHDVRVQQHLVGTLRGHLSEVRDNFVCLLARV